MLAHDLLGMAELQRQLGIARSVDHASANRVPLRGRQLLKMMQRVLARAGELLDPQQILIVEGDPRKTEAPAGFHLHPPPARAFPQLVAGDAKQPRSRRRLAGAVAPARQQRRGERLASQIRRDLLDAHTAGKEREDCGEMTAIERRERRTVSSSRRHQQIVVAAQIVGGSHHELVCAATRFVTEAWRPLVSEARPTRQSPVTMIASRGTGAQPLQCGRIIRGMKPDDELIKRVAAGDGEAFAELVRPYRAELLRFAVRMLGSDEQAGEEVVQESLLSAYRAVKQGAHPESMRPWLFAIVRNCALNTRRRSQPTYALTDEDGHAVQVTPNEAAEQGEWIDWLMGAIAELPSRQRQALIGRELEGRSHAELAVSLGTSTLAVKTLLHRARGRLRRLRADSMLSVPLLLKGRAAGLKAGVGVLGQAFAAASVTTLIVMAVHAGAGGTVRAAGLPPVLGTRASSIPRRLLSAAAPRRRPTQRQIEHEGRRAISRCNHGLSVRGTSSAGLVYAVGHLSTDELEYTECEQVLNKAALRSARGAAHRNASGCSSRNQPRRKPPGRK